MRPAEDALYRENVSSKQNFGSSVEVLKKINYLIYTTTYEFTSWLFLVLLK